MTAKFFIITAAVLACLVIISAGLAIEGGGHHKEQSECRTSEI